MNEINRLRVLVVEDHGFQREYIANCLSQIGIEQILTAMDGEEALDNMTRLESSGQSFDVVICDLQMPNMDGIAFIRNLAERHFTGAIIILTAMDASLVSSVTRMVKEYKLNFIGSLHKPLDTKLLISYVIEACERKDVSVSPPLPNGISEEDLIAGFDAGGLTAHFQPKFNFSDKRLVGVEALARLILPDNTVIYPDDFLYLYSKLKRTKECELKIYEQGFKLLRQWINKGYPVQVSVNFCANMLGDPDFYDAVVALAAQYAIPHDLVTIEVTERSLIDNIAMSIEFLARLRINGFNLAVDDFGTGYSSIKQLELLPFNELKIDKSFLIGVDTDSQKRAIVQSITELARRMNLKTVAEGIENHDSWDIAKQYGCDICQGYFTGKPMSFDDILDLPWRK